MRRGAAESRASAAHGRLAGPDGIFQVEDLEAVGAVEDDLGMDGVPDQGDGQARLLARPGRDMVQVPAGMAAYALTEPDDALDTMSPGAPAAQLQWNLTAFCLSEAWITRTRDLPEGEVSSSLRTLSFAWPFTRRAVAVYALSP